jgi:mannose-6-phosphate isomerase
MRRDDGHFHTAIDAVSRAPHGAFSLYEAAFYLFALAEVHGLPHGYPAYETARAFLDILRQGWGKSNGGFDESRPPSLPLKSNPHMHLLEAALAWIDATEQMPGEQAVWLHLAQEMVALALSRFVDPVRGVVREFFDESWAPMVGEGGRIVEPGHQFEWACLLLQWAQCRHCAEAHAQASRRVARRLMDVAERHGVDAARGVAINELWDDMTPKDASAKLWPQTERIKAWCAVLQDSQPEEADAACRHLVEAMRALQRYLAVEPAGLWQELLHADGAFSREPSKASSFYHIVCAIETLDRCMASFKS